MLRVKNAKSKNGKFHLTYEFDDVQDKIHEVSCEFETKSEAYKHYASLCWHYSIQCCDKIRFIADSFAVKYPEWMDGLVELDFGKLSTTVLQKAAELNFKTANKDAATYLKSKVKNLIEAATELQKICINKKL